MMKHTVALGLGLLVCSALAPAAVAQISFEGSNALNTMLSSVNGSNKGFAVVGRGQNSA